MIEALLQGTLSAFSLSVLPWVLGGALIGLIFGIMPGIGVAAAMAIALPLTYTMDAAPALSLLVAIHAVGVTGGSITAIVLNIPGTGLNAATLIDGFPMAQKGEAGRAIGAALTASGLGGIFGGLVLIALIPMAYPIVMAFGAAETFLVALLGLVFLAALSRGSLMKGLAAGLIGILLSFIGLKGMTAMPRFTFGSLHLMDGIALVPVVMGLFALPEALDLVVKGGTIAKLDKARLAAASQWKQLIEGCKDVFRHWRIFLQSSAIGTFVGTIPGVGGQTAVFVAYAQAKQTSSHPELYGTGYVEGVIAPEAANNSKEGGSMLPTLAFGIPGSALMALLLAGFLIQGIIPGPGMMKENLVLTFTLVVTLVFSNIIGVLFLMPFIGKITKICFVPGSILGPLILVLAAFGGYAATSSYTGILITFVFGGLGVLMVRFGFDRVCLLLGFILGIIVETYFYIAVSAHGFSFLVHPIPLVLEIMIILVLSSGWLRDVISKRKKRA